MTGVPRLRLFHPSIWVLPLTLAALFGALGVALPLLEQRAAVAHVVNAVFSGRMTAGSPSSAQVLLATSAGALATVLSVTFSLTLVMFQLAATQYSSRLVRRFMDDDFVKGALGLYLGTVIYLLAVLRTVRLADEGGPFDAPLSVLVGMLATVAALALLPSLLHRVARTLEAASVAADLGREAVAVITGLPPRFPLATVPDTPPDWTVRTERTGFLRHFDGAALRAALPAGARFARVDTPMGLFILPGRVLVSVWGGVGDEARAQHIERSFDLGAERDLARDPLYGVRRLVDVALRALSPAVNDVTTAVRVVNELGAIVLAALRVGVTPSTAWRLVAARPVPLAVPGPGLEELLQLAFQEISLCASQQPHVLRRILELLSEVAPAAQDETARLLLLRVGTRVRRLAERGLVLEEDRAELVDAWRRLRARLVSPGAEAPRELLH